MDDDITTQIGDHMKESLTSNNLIDGGEDHM